MDRNLRSDGCMADRDENQKSAVLCDAEGRREGGKKRERASEERKARRRKNERKRRIGRGMEENEGLGSNTMVRVQKDRK
jgi:hypothetical protein